MGEQLYNSDILRLALATAGFARLAQPQGSAERRSTICGSRIIVDVILDDRNRVAEMGHEVRACALGQAAAALVDQYALGHTVRELTDARDAMKGYLAGESDDPGPWPGLAIFGPARPHSARHPAILLAFDAVTAAAQAAMERKQC
jgi:NifU-like protein involved in Fe-S cluster formation